VRVAVGTFGLVAVAAGCSASGGSPSTRRAAADSTAHLAHAAYTSAINSNNLDSLMGMMTEDVVFLAAHAPPMVGKAAVRRWAEGYLQAYTTSWNKKSQEFRRGGRMGFRAVQLEVH
jgi:ketosteroid isomerase-like protein